MGGVASPDRRFALVVNTALARSQDQLHIHAGCLAPFARRALDAAAPRLAVGEWSLIGPLVPHQPFWAFRTGKADLGRLELFRLAAEGFADRVRKRALLTVAIASACVDEFVVLASYAGAPHAWWPEADTLLLRAAPLLVAIDRDDFILGTAARAPGPLLRQGACARDASAKTQSPPTGARLALRRVWSGAR
jgi:hypothetical protein